MVKCLLERLQIKYPIIQAPMAGGITTPQLVSSVSNLGGLGMIAAGYLSPNRLRETIKEVKKLTSRPFGVNIFVPNAFSISNQHVENMQLLMRPIYEALHLNDDTPPKLPKIEEQQATYEEQLQIILDENVKTCSFTFGLPTAEQIGQLQQQETFVIGTATTVREALTVQEIGMDAVVMQGSEAGGHRSHFQSSFEEGRVGLMALIPQAEAEIDIPIIAAGGIMNGKGIRASLTLGAQAAQMGTSFLTVEESGAHKLHKEAILKATEEEVGFTKAFSGKWARGVRNAFMNETDAYAEATLPFPIQNSLTQAIRKEAAKQHKQAYMSLWSGQAPRLARRVNVEQFMEQLIKEIE